MTKQRQHRYGVAAHHGLKRLSVPIDEVIEILLGHVASELPPTAAQFARCPSAPEMRGNAGHIAPALDSRSTLYHAVVIAAKPAIWDARIAALRPSIDGGSLGTKVSAAPSSAGGAPGCPASPTRKTRHDQS